MPVGESEDLSGKARIPKRLGLLINPVAGIGGRVGLKGSDGAEIQREAYLLGAEPEAGKRAALALQALQPWRDSFELLTAPQEMGEMVACQYGFKPLVLGAIHSGATTANDTIEIARDMQARGVDLLLFVGGDGTARDIYQAVGCGQAALGIPAGVKVHSGVFAVNPQRAGDVCAQFLQGREILLREREVVDLDEEAYRAGKIATQLFGNLLVPYRPRMVQSLKAPSAPSELVQLRAIAAQVIEEMSPGRAYILGPGTTIRAIAAGLGFPKTLVGVDVLTRERVLALDASERQLLEVLETQPAYIIVTPIGGQGFLFGRGNQPISPEVIRQVGRGNILVASLPDKLNALRGRPLLVDTGDADIDQMLSGYIKVVTGYHESVIYRVSV
jgi:predicted polyphosphate/ATP-dependent NAD kinase